MTPGATTPSMAPPSAGCFFPSSLPSIARCPFARPETPPSHPRPSELAAKKAPTDDTEETITPPVSFGRKQRVDDLVYRKAVSFCPRAYSFRDVGGYGIPHTSLTSGIAPLRRLHCLVTSPIPGDENGRPAEAGWDIPGAARQPSTWIRWALTDAHPRQGGTQRQRISVPLRARPRLWFAIGSLFPASVPFHT